MESNELVKEYDKVQSLISRVQSYILNEKNTEEIYLKLRIKLKKLIESIFTNNQINFLIQKDLFKLMLNTFNLMKQRDPESQLHTLELVSLIVGTESRLTPSEHQKWGRLQPTESTGGLQGNRFSRLGLGPQRRSRGLLRQLGQKVPFPRFSAY